MLLILLSWFYIFLVCTSFGSIIDFFTQKKALKIEHYFLIGLLFQLLLITSYAFFLPINSLFYIVNSLFTLLLLLINYKRLLFLITLLFKEIASLSIGLKLLLIFIFLTALMQSATIPFMPDNESYYIQTIKWLNEYGLVKGLANLHLFLGQTSGWHILQSAYNFSFLTDSLNDINGFLLVVIFFMSVKSLHHFTVTRKKSNLFLGLLPVFSPFLYRFLNTPSPDLPVFVISYFLFFLFFKLYNAFDKDLYLTFILSIFLLILVKVTVCVLLILPVFIFLKHHKQIDIRLNLVIISFAFIVFISFLLKNYIISGFPLYPLTFSFTDIDWQVPLKVQEHYYSAIKMYSFSIDNHSFFNRLSFFDKFIRWLTLDSFHGLFNKVMVLLLLTSPFFIKKKALFLVILYAAFQFFILFITSPQYRFFFHLIMLLFGIIATRAMYIRYRLVKALLYFSVFCCFLLLLFPINSMQFRNNGQVNNQEEPFHLKSIFKPPNNSRYSFSYKYIKEGNFGYYSPLGKEVYFWYTSNIPLPALNKEQLNFYKEHFFIVPQLRGASLAEGFVSKTIQKPEQ